MTLISGVGTVVPSVTPLTALTATVKQQPLGTVIIAVLVTLSNVSTAAGVDIALLVGLASPLTVIATAIGVTVPPVGIPMLPLKVTT